MESLAPVLCITPDSSPVPGMVEGSSPVQGSSPVLCITPDSSPVPGMVEGSSPVQGSSPVLFITPGSSPVPGMVPGHVAGGSPRSQPSPGLASHRRRSASPRSQPCPRDMKKDNVNDRPGLMGWMAYMLTLVVLLVFAVLAYSMQNNIFNTITAVTTYGKQLVDGVSVDIRESGKVVFNVASSMKSELIAFTKEKQVVRMNSSQGAKVWTNVSNLEALPTLVRNGDYPPQAKEKIIEATNEYIALGSSQSKGVWITWTAEPGSQVLATGRIGIVPTKGRKVNVFLAYFESDVSVKYKRWCWSCDAPLDDDTKKFLQDLYTFEVLDKARIDYPDLVDVKVLNDNEEL